MNTFQFSIREAVAWASLFSLFLGLTFAKSGNLFGSIAFALYFGWGDPGDLLVGSFSAASVLLNGICAPKRNAAQKVFLGASSAIVGATILGLATVSGLQKMDYWNWSHDYPLFVWYVVKHALFGGGCAAVLALVTAIRYRDRVRSRLLRRSPPS